MTYQVLARKWRPKTFAEVVGQEHVTQALINALNQQRLHHAYLLTGTRGVGKTTLGRLFAKALNCEQGISSKPCGKCQSCLSIDQGNSLDLIEVDAASRTKVEDTRELLENIQYAPANSRFKIYLIDEVHMLSTHSFNALLKTLEEPPKHVKFLLATTDPEKLPVTVISRCLQFNLKNLESKLIAKHLDNILQQENISFETDAILEIAKNAKGSVRDALSILDQAIAYGAGNVNSENVRTMLGSINQAHIYQLLNELKNNQLNPILNIIDHAASHACDFTNIADELIAVLHHLAILKFDSGCYQDDWGDEGELQNLAKKFTDEELQLYYQIALLGKRDLYLAPNPQLGFEMLMLRMLAFRPTSQKSNSKTQQNTQHPNDFTNQQLRNENKKQESSASSTNVKNKSNPAYKLETTQKDLQKNSPNIQNNTDWQEIYQQLNLAPSIKALAAHLSLKELNKNKITLFLHSKHAPLLSKKSESQLSKSIANYFGYPIEISIEIARNANTSNTPHNIEEQRRVTQQKNAEQKIDQNHMVREIMQQFDATIVPNSIKTINEER
ncbi:MAG: DNA polymerase III subunit gamma/tau [Gammaproteobacteria bacterium]|nr:DNA polymerase III subunit gamma/tau [Gammaproteobacteria bacterium]